MRILLVPLLVSAALLAQSRDEWKQRFGSPVSETFAVRPGIGVKVKHRPDGSLAEILILPIRTDSLVESRNMTLEYGVAKNVLDELLPPSRRGKSLMGGFVNGVCMPENDCAGSSEDYENVHIFYNSSAKPGQLCCVDIRFKN